MDDGDESDGKERAGDGAEETLEPADERRPRERLKDDQRGDGELYPRAC